MLPVCNRVLMTRRTLFAKQRPPTPPTMTPPNAPAWWDGITTDVRATLTHHTRADVCVVGLGGSGLAAVRAARELGAHVVGVDAGRIAGAAAGRNGGLLLGGLAPFHHDAVERWGDVHARAFYSHTLSMLQDLAQDSEADTWWQGSLRIAMDDAELGDCARQHDQMIKDGLPVDWYEGAEGHGLLFPSDGASHPVRRAMALADRVQAAGAELYEFSPVSSVQSGLVQLSNGARIQAPAILVCADGALGTLLPSLADRVRPVRLQMLATAPATDVLVPRPVYARYGYDYWQQLPDGRVLLGGGRDHFVDDEYTHSDLTSDAVQDYLESCLRRCVRTIAPVTHRWAATVSYSADDLPIAEQVDEGVYGAGAYSGTGNVVGGLCGRGLARRALGERDAFMETLEAVRRGGTAV